MRKLVYWIADHLHDNPCYSIRGRRKKDVRGELASERCDASQYGKPRKVAIKYSDAFDLMAQLMSEGGAEYDISDDPAR
jgi:hypothetical protein